ncbi:PAS/PAC sensor hybrid histidine kinase [Cylindrospermum stagnale PCC 7417]|uniref:histidine kinase n=1 Tax=Cylindrospermum stagnale PCC 7417 TaxID=56107 RepID=K9X1J6_9NOST|nr:response regulator [Cylindrospermum stagnale]AFZ25911.1 PAS/PAC sensor hybrid histidine kinase [Cylindrospermum stagnale PCC 7417]
MAFDAKVNILLVDDHSENLLALEAILQSLGQNLVRATSGAQALRCLLSQDFAVILLDVQMPDMDGFETATLIRQRERSHFTPIIFLTAFSTSDSMVFKGYSLGAVDYLFKPLDSEILRSKVAAFVDLFQKTAEVERQAAELMAVNAQLRKSEEQFRSLSACSPVGIFLTDIAGRCTYTNPRYQSILGLNPTESLAADWWQSLYPEDQPQALAEWFICIREGREYSREFRILTPAGILRWVSLRSSPMFSDQGEVVSYVGTIEDISDRQQAEEERTKLIREQAALKEAKAANRMKDEFLATLSHELRTPLNSILGWSKLLRNRKLDPKAITRALETIERNALLQEQLIEDILDVSRIIRGKLYLNLCSINLVSVIEAAVDTVRLQAEAKNILFNFLIVSTDTAKPKTITLQDKEEFTPSVPPSSSSFAVSLAPPSLPFLVSGDPDRLQQVVWNLLTNAIKFTAEGGRVEIKLSAVSHPETQQTAQSYAQIQVSDTGIGIKPDFLAYVFDRFRQADGSTTRTQTGLGLGLAIARHLVELHGGSIHADSPGEGLGATFTVKLPLLNVEDSLPVEESSLTKQTEATLEPNSPKLLHPLPLDNLLVLVVDDDPDTRHFLTIALEESGARVTAVDSVDQALSKIQQYPPDILISDIGMPTEDGYTLIRRLRRLEAEQGSQIPAIALTAYAREEDSTEALAAGFNMYASKPVELTTLINMVTKLVGRNCHVE